MCQSLLLLEDSAKAPSSVRATNVYEEQSLGIFEDDDPEEDEENELVAAGGSRVTAWSRYLVMHARKQLAFGKPFSTHALRAILMLRVQICGGSGSLLS